jgi:hypothetical protein
VTGEDLPQRVRVTQSHVTSDPDPVRFRAGDALGVGHHDQVWTHYIWATDQAGRSGWAPDEYLQLDDDGHRATALRDYDSTELTVGRGEIVDVLDEAGGWYLCRTTSGQSGWVPSTSVEPLGPAAGS